MIFFRISRLIVSICEDLRDPSICRVDSLREINEAESSDWI